MIDTHDEKNRAGPSAVPDAGSTGTAGLSRTAAKREHMTPGAGNAGQGNEELEWARRHMADEPVPEPAHEVFRKTALHDTPPEGDDELSRLREKMLAQLRRKRPEILYMPFETAFRDFVCSLLARQYREENELRQQMTRVLGQVAELQDRLEKRTTRIDRRLEILEDRGRYP